MTEILQRSISEQTTRRNWKQNSRHWMIMWKLQKWLQNRATEKILFSAEQEISKMQ